MSRYKLSQVNEKIDFSRERHKSNARKTPTSVRCVQCNEKFVLPFRPRNPKVFCDACFKEKNKHKTKSNKFDEEVYKNLAGIKKE